MSIPNWVVAQRNPAAVVAASQAKTTPIEDRQIEQYTFIRDLNRKFSKMDLDKGRKEFAKLDPQVQEIMRGYFGTSGYLEPSVGWFQRANETLQDIATSPLRFFMDAASKYNKTLNLLPNTAGQALVSGEQVDVNMMLSRKTFEASWDGRGLYDYDALSKIESGYGKEISFVAKQMLMGRLPGEIIEARGQINDEFVDALDLALNNPDRFKHILDDFERAKLSPGRDLARRVYGTKVGRQPGDKGFTALSGTVDAIYQIMIDPLTYTTFGIGTAATKGARLAQIVGRSGDAGIARIFTDNSVRKLWDEVGPKLDQLNSAREAKDVIRAGTIRREIAETYGRIGDDKVIDLLASSGVKDAATAQNFFEQAENMGYLASGRVDNATFYRTGIATAYRNQNLRNWFTTQLKSVAQGRIKEVDAGTFNDVVDGLREVGKRIDTLVPMPEGVLKATEEYDTVVQRARNYFSRHPGSQAIYWRDDLVEESLPQVRALTRMLGFDKNFSFAFSELFRGSSQEQRIDLIRGLYVGVMRKQGADDEFIKKFMDEKFAFTRQFGVQGEITLSPTAKQILSSNASEVVERDVLQIDGALHMSQATPGVSALPFDDLMSNAAANSLNRVTIAKPIQLIGGTTRALFQSKTATSLTSHWSFANLFPRLGIRSAIDEATFGAQVAANQEIKMFANGRRMRNIQTAGAGSDRAVGPLKNILYKATGRGQYSISDDVRRELADLHDKATYMGANKVSLTEKAKAIDTLQNKYKFSIDDIVNYDASQYVFLHASNLYGKRLPKDLIDLKLRRVKHNPYSAEGMIQSFTARTSNGSINRAQIVGNPISPTNFDSMIKDAGIEFRGKFKTFTAQQIKALGLREWHAVWLKNSLIRLNGNVLKFSNNDMVDLGELFFKNNGLKTPEDFQRAVDETMIRSGFIKQGNIWQVADESKARMATEWTGDTAARTSNTPEISLAQIYYTQTVARYDDIYLAFHGSQNKFNDQLFNYVSDMAKNKYYGDYSKALVNIDFDEYQKLAGDFLTAPTVSTDLVLPGKFNDDDALNIIERTENNLMDWMDRQLTGLYRSPAFESAATVSQLKWEPARNQYLQKLISGGMDKRAATYQADRVFTEIAMNEAVGRVMKYVDNPDIRSQLSYSLKNAGRYLRATEDFIRRVYRLKDVKWQTLYRLRLMDIGMNGSGLVYTDGEGEKYFIFPGDNIIYNVMDSVLTAIYGKNEFMRAGKYNQFTGKFSLANPSLQPDAARPTLSGPMSAITVVGIRNLLGLTNNPTVEGWADDLDELFLGPMGKDVTAVEAVMPSLFRNVWRLLSPEERERQLSSAALSAIAYNFDVDNPLLPDSSAEDREKYLRAIRVSTMNTLVLRTIFGILSPVTPTVQESQQLPKYLKDLGLTSPTQEYQSILSGVLEMAQRNEDFDGDPFEIANRIFAQNNPGKYAYTIPRTNRTIKTYIVQNEETKDWIIRNRPFIKKYGADAALIFSPRTGEYERAAGKWFRQEGFGEAAEIEEFLDKVQVAELKSEYFRLGKEKDEALAGTANLTDRRLIAGYYENRRAMLKASSPLLAKSLEIPTPSDEMDIYVKVRELAGDEKFPMSKTTRDRLQQMLNVFDSAYVKLTAAEPPYATDYTAFKASVRLDAEDQLKMISGSDPQLSLLYKMVFEPIMSFYSRDRVPIIPSR